MESEYVVALVTAPDVEVARGLARKALEAKLAACANIVPGVESHYWWQGKIDTSAEVLIIFKTTASQTGALQANILANHLYETPEFITVPITSGSRAYLEWISASAGARS